MTDAETAVRNLVARGVIEELRVTELYEPDAKPMLARRFQVTAVVDGQAVITFPMGFSREQAFADMLRDLALRGVE